MRLKNKFKFDFDYKKILADRERLLKYCIAGVLIIVAVVFMFTECSKDDDVESALNNVTIEENKVEEVTLSMNPVTTLNPLISTDEDTFYISKLIYSSLYRLDEKMAPEGDLADGCTFGDGEVTVSLRNAKWHDGERVTAEDVEFTYKAIKAIGAAGEYFEKADKIKSVEAVGSDVVVTFKDKEDISLSYLMFPIVPEHKYGSVNTFLKKVENFTPVGSGMFKFDSFDEGNYMKLVKNSSYYGKKATSDVKIKVVRVGSNETKMVEASNVTVFYDKTSDRATKLTKKNMEISDFVGNEVEFIGFNFNNEFLKKKNVRKAIAYGLNIDNIIEEIYYKSAVKSDSIFYPEYLGSTKIKDEYEYNVDKALAVLKKAKLEDTNDNGILDNGKGVELKLNLVVNSDNPTRVQVAEEIKTFLAQLHIEVTVTPLATDAYLGALGAGAFDMYVGGMVLDESMNLSPLLTTGGLYNYTGYSDKKVDKNFKKMLKGQDNEKNTQVVNDLKEHLNDSLPYYPIGYKSFGIVKAPVFNGELHPTFDNPYGGIESWYCIYEKRIVDEEPEEEE